MKKNLLILGASGGVATTLLLHLTSYRSFFGTIILLDKSDSLLKNPFIDQKKLQFTFIQSDFQLPEYEQTYKDLLKKYAIDIVIDLTDLDTFPILTLTNACGVAYINTCMNDPDKTSAELISTITDTKKDYQAAPHILCTGMNPGAVNMWVEYGVRHFGIPAEIVHFEFDTSVLVSGWQPMQTWSRFEFIVEGILNPGGKMLGRRKVKECLPNSIKHRVDMQDMLSPIMELTEYPKGMQILHEENVSLAEKYNIPSQFVYAIYPQTVDYLENLFDQNKEITINQLVFGDNTTHPLHGADNIGVYLEYADKRIYYFNSISNSSVRGTNATYTQVVLGILPALFMLVFQKVKPGVYFVEDLYDTIYPEFLFDLMKVEEFVFEKQKELKLVKHTPQIKFVSRKKRRLSITHSRFPQLVSNSK